MAKIKVLLPAMGEGVIEATITRWLKQVGEHVEEDDPIVEIATDKVDSEIPSPVTGKLARQFFNENDVPKVGDLIAVIEAESVENIDDHLILTTNDSDVPDDDASTKNEKYSAGDQGKKVMYSDTNEYVSEVSHISSKSAPYEPEKFLSPLVRSIAKKENISYDTLMQIPGSGLNGRVTKDDVLSWLNKSDYSEDVINTSSTKKESSDDIEQQSVDVPVPSLPGDEIVEMSRMRKLIAGHMVMSKRVSPHVTSFVEADVTHLVNWRDKNKALFQERHKEKLTYTPIFIEAVLKAIADFPGLNVSVSGTNIIRHKQVNIGMATALPGGNLIVPVIKQADEKNLVGLARSVNDIAGRARNNKLKPDEIKGGTFTITNVGTFNNITGTPVINQPEVAVLALGAIKKKPAVIETPGGDTIGIRQIMVIAMSYDHRVVDGALGGMFLNRVSEYLENFDISRSV